MKFNSIVYVLVVWILSIHLSFADLVGSIEGDLKVDDNGHLNYQLPLNLPKPNKGFSPNLSINYAQGGGNSVLGIGFSLGGLSSITRCSKNFKIDGIQEGIRFDEQSEYCLDGERLIDIGNGEYYLYNSKKIKIKRHGSKASPEHWSVFDSEGFIKEYGIEDTALINSSRGVTSWKISKVLDRLDNEALYSYIRINNELYIDKIEYQQYKINFVYESRPDTLLTYMFGNSINHDKRLNNIQVYSFDKLFYSYKINYNQIDKSQNLTRYSKIKDISYCDKDGNCLNPVSFDYQTNYQKGMVEDKSYINVNELLNYVVADMNRDGYNDVCYYDGDLNCAINRGDGTFGSANKWTESLHTQENNDKKEQEKRSAISSSLTLLDINKDRYVDYCVATSDGIMCGINNKQGQFVNNGYYTKAFNIENAFRFVDINNDRQVDICAFKENGLECSINNKGTFSTNPIFIDSTNQKLAFERRYTLKTSQQYNQEFNDGQEKMESSKIPQPQLIDIDGDGFQDMCGFKEDSNNFYCSLGTGYTQQQLPKFSALKEWGKSFPLGEISSINIVSNSLVLLIPNKKIENSIKLNDRFNHTFRFSDLNNDGLADICYRNGDNYECRINNGSGFNAPKSWFKLDPILWTNTNQNDTWAITNQENSIMLEDMDGDGVSDFSAVIGDSLMVAHNENESFQNFKEMSKILPDLNIIEKNKKLYTTPLKKWFGLKTEFRTAIVSMAFGPIKVVDDLDGKENKEICYRSSSGLSCVAVEEEPMALLNGVTNSFGMKTSISYDNMLKAGIYTPQNNAIEPIGDYSPNAFVVKNISTDNAIGGQNSLSYQYEGYKIDNEWGGLGFSKISVTNHAKEITSVTEYYREASNANGLIKSSQEYVQGHLVGLNSLFYDLISDGSSKVKHSRITEQMDKKYDLNGNELSSKNVKYANYTSYDQAQSITEKNIDSTGLDYSTVTETKYLNNIDSWIMGKPLDIKVTHSTLNTTPIVKQTWFEYDDNGMLKKETIEPNNNLSLNIEYTLDDEKRTVSTTDREGHTRISYEEMDKYGRVIEKKNSLGHRQRISYDDYCNLPEAITNENDLTTNYEYDGLCRKTKEMSPSKTLTEYFYEWSDGADFGLDYQHIGFPPNDTSRYMITTKSTNGGYGRVYFDAINRKVREVSLGKAVKGTNTEIFKEYAYNAKDELIGSSVPHKKGTFAGENIVWNQNSYDALGRIIAQTQLSSKNVPLTTTIQYDGFKTITTSPKNHIKTSFSNARGQLLKVLEHDGSSIEYKYDVLNNLISTKTNGKVSTVQYDIFGNKISQNDISLGKWSYKYNAFKELVEQIDAKGNKTEIIYDEIGRVIKKYQNSKETSFVYDTSEYGIGKLASSSNAEVKKSYIYDSLGRLQSTIQEIDEQNLHTQYEYDEADRLSQVVYPSGLKMNYGYDINGNFEKVSIPKKDIWTEKFIDLEASLKETFEYIQKLEQEADKIEKNVQYYKEQYEYYRQLTNIYDKKETKLQDEVNKLNALKAQINARINANQKIANDYRAKAAEYKKLFGNTVLKYVRTVAGNAYYENTDCTKTNWKGSCKQRNNFQVYIPTWMAQSQYCVKNWKTGKTTCTWGPQASINVSEVFYKWADYYQIQANTFEVQRSADLAKVNASIASTQNLLNTYTDLESKNRELANSYLKRANEEAKILLDITNELTKQMNAQEKMEEDFTDILTDDGEELIWAVSSRDAMGRIDAQLYGNGLLSTKEYAVDDTVTRVKTGVGDKLIQDLRYSYDERFNPISKEEFISKTKELYTYDEMDRLVKWEYNRGGNAPLSKMQEYRYDIDGNMIFKTNVGQMGYNAKNQLTSASSDKSFRYDANGNMIEGNAKSYEYTSFNKVSKLAYQGNQEAFFYDEGENLVKKVSNGDTITYYGDDGYEMSIKKTPTGGEEIKMKHSVMVEGKAVAVHERTIYEDKKKADKTAYIHQDAQGSTSMVTTNTQAIAFKNEFTPFGEEISSLDNKTLKKEDFRGYTGHKMVGTSGVIDMNARMYDPFIVRFTSPDTIIPDFSNPMAYNRYAYVYGNPVKYIDPDGHCPWLFLAGVAIFTVSATSDNTTVQAVGMTIGSLMMGGGAEMLVGKGAVFAQGATVGFTSGFIVSGGNIGESLKGGALGGLGAQLSNAIGHHLGFSDGSIGQTFAHGVSQGTISHLRGGDFRSGFIGGVLSKASGGVMEHLGLFQGDSTMDVMGGTAVSMVVGGITSDAAGGSFMDGALSAMAVHLWNEKFGSSLMMAEKGRHLYSYEKKMARHYYIPEVDINNAIIHNGAVPWYLSDDKAGITRGNDIYIRDGDYNPDTAFGMSLLIHELKHVGQYREGYLSVGTYIISTSIHGYRGSPFEDIAYKVGDSVYNDLKNRGYNNREQIWDGSLWK